MLQLEAVSAEQEIIPVEASATRFEGPYGKRVLVTIIDVTERYKLEQLKREFYSMVSHDIRTPLTTVGVVLELSNQGQYGPISDELSEKLTTAEKNTQRLLELVDRLLSVEKLEEGRVELSFEDASIAEILEGAAESVSQLCEEKEIKLETKVTPEDAHISCDKSFIVQVVTNLISNAIKYSPRGGVINVIATRGFTAVEVSVADHGPAIPESKKSTIFERFRKQESAR